MPLKNYAILLLTFLASFSFSQSFEYSTNQDSLIQAIISTKKIELLNPQKEIISFDLEDAFILPTSLQERFPNIKSYRGKNNSQTIRLDINENGVFAWVKGEESFFLKSTSTTALRVYLKEIPTTTFEDDLTNHTDEIPSNARKTNTQKKGFAGTLRTYRLALACTGEYATFHGGTTSKALAAMVTSINRVNEVFEVDLGIRLELITNNDVLIFLNASTDPFTNTNPDSLIYQNQREIDNRIGTTNYDIGHVFSTGGGGIADFASVCGPYKAGGVTGTKNPIGDPYDIDYVSHEMGHQFGADHTFSTEVESCGSTKEKTSAYEVGAGSTIMAYAGLCSPHNLQTNSDAYFHSTSINAIRTFVTNGRGNTCGTTITNGNTSPQISLSNTTFNIPINTPFELSAQANDLEDDTLTYCWEQYDLGSGTDPLNPIGTDPIFRSFKPTLSSTRTFPANADLLTGTTSFGELLPSYAREMNFKLMVRDNHPNGGGTNDADLKVFAIANTGPFKVTSQTNTEEYRINDKIEITWNVANTNLHPINCNDVVVLFSADGGYTFTDTLLVTENDGSAIVQIPTTITTKGRIKVKGKNNIFFSINPTSFTVLEPTYPNFSFLTSVAEQEICAGDSIIIDIQTTAYLGFNSPILFSIQTPSGIEAIHTKNNITPGNTTSIVLKSTGYTGTFNYTITATSDTITHTRQLALRTHFSNALTTITNQSPTNGNTNTTLKPLFTWAKIENADYYTLKMSETSGFTISETFNFLTDTSFLYPTTLEPASTYYYILSAFNNCGSSLPTAITEFHTSGDVCTNYKSTDTPFLLPLNKGEFNSIITIDADKIVSNVSIKNIKGTHEWTSDLSFYLINPSLKRIALASDVCNGNFSEDFDFGFNDNSTLGLAPCPPTDGKTYRPLDSFKTLTGNAANGNWTLQIIDDYQDLDSGELLSWELEVCVEDPLTAVTVEKQLTSSIFPNPATNTIEIQSSYTITSTRILNHVGQEVLQSDSTKIDVSALHKGIYFYESQTSNGEVRGTFVKF